MYILVNDLRNTTNVQKRIVECSLIMHHPQAVFGVCIVGSLDLHAPVFNVVATSSVFLAETFLIQQSLRSIMLKSRLACSIFLML